MSSIGVYRYVIRTRIIRSLAYKFDVYGNILMQTIIMTANAFFWRALYGNSQVSAEATAEDMLTYTVVSAAISIILSTNVERRITQSVQKGSIAIDMLRPVNIFAVFFAEDLGALIALLFQNLLPVLAIGCLVARPPIPHSASGFGLFVVSLCMAFFINWLMAAIFGMWSFRVVNMDSLIQVKKHLIRLLSGSIIPIWFFPQGLRSVLELLPFAYLYQLPLDFFIGHYDTQSAVRGLCVQLFWLILLWVVFLCLQKRVTRRLLVQGG